MSRTTELIPWPAHQRWYERTLGEPATALLIAMVDGTPACMVRFDTLGPGAAEVHINMNPALRGKGLGKPILAAACAYGFDHRKLSSIYASIKAENVPSIKIFASVGFVRSGERAGLLSYKLTRLTY